VAAGIGSPTPIRAKEFRFGSAEIGHVHMAVSLTSRLPGRFVMPSWRKV